MPGTGALIAILGIGAVAFIVLRRNDGEKMHPKVKESLGVMALLLTAGFTLTWIWWNNFGTIVSIVSTIVLLIITAILALKFHEHMNPSEITKR